jgi:hypothetical protein
MCMVNKQFAGKIIFKFPGRRLFNYARDIEDQMRKSNKLITKSFKRFTYVPTCKLSVTRLSMYL